MSSPILRWGWRCYVLGLSIHLCVCSGPHRLSSNNDDDSTPPNNAVTSLTAANIISCSIYTLILLLLRFSEMTEFTFCYVCLCRFQHREIENIKFR